MIRWSVLLATSLSLVLTAELRAAEQVKAATDGQPDPHALESDTTGPSSKAAAETRVDGGRDYTPRRDLRGFEPTYLVYAFDEEDHIEFKISVKYPLLDTTIGWFGKWIGGSNQLYFSYTGKYDFFVLSDEKVRPSAPVISRLQNPGLFITNSRPASSDGGLEKISLGWFHESNGQQIQDNQTFMNTPNASDYVSRGWDYLGMDMKFRSLDPWYTSGSVNYYVRLKLFCNCQGFGAISGKEDDITIFGGTRTAEISDYDGFRFIIDNYANDRWHYGINLRTGTSSSEAFRNISFRIEMTYRLSNVPIKLFYFNGYGKDISTYHIKDEYFGLGFEFW